MTTKYYNIKLNKFLKDINLKKQYLKKLENKTTLLNKFKETNFKTVNSKLFKNLKTTKKSTNLINYIINVAFTKKNTLLHITDCSGNLKFFYSAGSFQYKGKSKIFRGTVLKKFYRVLVSRLKFLQKKIVAVHFKNVNFNMFWFLKKLKKKMGIKIVKNFYLYAYNGCRQKKIRRKKIKN